jgi:hypothetical protein
MFKLDFGGMSIPQACRIRFVDIAPDDSPTFFLMAGYVGSVNLG